MLWLQLPRKAAATSISDANQGVKQVSASGLGTSTGAGQKLNHCIPTGDKKVWLILFHCISKSPLLEGTSLYYDEAETLSLLCDRLKGSCGCKAP